MKVRVFVRSQREEESVSRSSRVFLIVVLAALGLVGSATSSEGNVLASGSITDIEVSDAFGLHRTFSFTVLGMNDGSVAGQGLVIRTPAGTLGGDQPTHVQFDCARIDTSFNGLPTATLGGVVTASPNAAQVGKRFWTRVVDGGTKTDWNQGLRIFTTSDPVPCTEDLSLPYFANDPGNITVFAT